MLLERLVSAVGWRQAWAIEGVVVWAVVIPLALLGMRDRPEDVGQHVDGVAPAHADARTSAWGVTRADAMRTGFFWVVTGGVAASGMLSTAVAFHQISLLGERGLSAIEAAGNFLPQTAAALVATLATGALVDRLSPRWVTSTSMGLLAAGLVAGTLVAPGWSAIGFALLVGAAGGSIRTLEAAAFPKYYGTDHLGSIRGFVAAVGVGSTAFGPVLFAVIRDTTGSYNPALLTTAALPLLVGAAALMVRPPREDPHGRTPVTEAA